MSAQPLQQPFQWAKVVVPFVGGVHTRSDRKVIALPKLGLLENAVFSTPGALRKRNGFEKLAELANVDLVSGVQGHDRAIPDARSLMKRYTSLWLRSDTGVFAIDENKDRWLQEAELPMGHLEYGPRMWTATPIVSHPERATTNGITCYAYDIAVPGSMVVATFYDQNGHEIMRLTFTGYMPRLVVVGDLICLFYIVTPAKTNLAMATFDTNVIKSPYTWNTLIYSPATIATDLNATNNHYDCDNGPVPGTIAVAYVQSAASTVKWGILRPDGSQYLALATIGTAAQPAAVTCSSQVTTSTTGNVLLAWLMPSNVHVDGVMLRQDGSQYFAPKNFGTTTGGTVESLTSIFTGNTIVATAEVYWDVVSTAPYQYSKIARCEVLYSGFLTLTAAFLRHACLASKPWLRGADANRTTTAVQRVHLLTYRPTEPLPALRTQRTAFFVMAQGTNPIVYGQLYPNECQAFFCGKRKVPRVDVVGDRVWVTPVLMTMAESVDPATPMLYGGNACVNYGADQIPCWAEVGDATYFTGPTLFQFDSGTVMENGFLEFPEFDNSATYVSQNNVGGGLVAGHNYSYRVYYEWVSPSGEVQQSTFAGDVVVALTGVNNCIVLLIPSLTHTLKSGDGTASPASNAYLAVYRTLADGTVFYRAGAVPNSTINDSRSFTDTISDAVLATQAVDHRGSELANVQPPGGSVFTVGNTRAFMAGFEDQRLIVASKERAFGQGLSWNPAIDIILPEAGVSPITALSTIGDSLIAFLQDRTYVIGGDGPSNTGVSGAFAPPRLISNHIGSVGPSIVHTPIGIFFQSKKGIYFLGADFTMKYIGDDVEAFTLASSVRSAFALPDRHETRFCMKNGDTLLFDYLAGQWSRFPGIGGYHGIICKDLHCWLPGGTGKVLRETPGAYLDDGQPFGWALETAWLHIGEVQNHQRVRTVQLLGEWMGDHSSQVWIGYNYEQAWSDRILFDVSAVINGTHYGDDIVYGKFTATQPGNYGGNVGTLGLVSTGVYQVKLQPRRMRCQSIRLRWEETRRMDPAGVITYPWNEGARLNELAFEIGLRGGLWKPGVDRTFGAGGI